MPSFYHGSIRQYLVDVAKRLGKDLRNGMRKLTTARTTPVTRKSDLEETLGTLIAAGDFDQARAMILQMIEEARVERDGRKLHYLASGLERLKAYDVAYATRAEGHRLIEDPGARRWLGQIDPAINLVINPVKYDSQSISYAIQYASLFPLAAARVGSCTARLDPRLVPLFARSYPELRFVPVEGTEPDLSDPSIMVAGIEDLPALFATSEAEIRSAHRPLVADPDKVARFRQAYGTDQGPLIGLSWGSQNSRKDVPRLEDWAAVIKDPPGQVVSLQYGPIGAAVRKLSRLSGKPVIFDTSVDQMRDIDGFAAQLAAMDTILTISNTGAHLAGAMGLPTTVILDDKFHLTWPYVAHNTPWYPGAALVRKGGRPWPEALADIGTLQPRSRS